mmetsp:Transcript_8017/g.19752  ORF Transcript_8017/g.19752 Transcript_8017/m.19752 type:complete len:84 (+) Transcript_8017:316-567(+)
MKRFGPITYSQGDVADFLIVALDTFVGDGGLSCTMLTAVMFCSQIDENFSSFSFKESDTRHNYENAVKVETADFAKTMAFLLK